MLLTARQRQGGEMRPVHIMHKALGRRHTVQRIIVKNNQPMVRCKLDIQLDAVAVLRCGSKGGQAVLRRALVLAEKAAVGVIAPVERQAQLVAALAGPDGEQQKSCNQQDNTKQNFHTRSRSCCHCTAQGHKMQQLSQIDGRFYKRAQRAGFLFSSF